MMEYIEAQKGPQSKDKNKEVSKNSKKASWKIWAVSRHFSSNGHKANKKFNNFLTNNF